MRNQNTLCIFLFGLIASIVAMDDKTKERELIKIYPEQISDNAEIGKIKIENLSEIQIKIGNEEERFCTICLQPFEFNNDKFKVEIIDKECVRDHKIHESNFHKKCIRQWMKLKNTCPICRKTLKDSFSNRVRKKIFQCFQKIVTIIRIIRTNDSNVDEFLSELLTMFILLLTQLQILLLLNSAGVFNFIG